MEIFTSTFVLFGSAFIGGASLFFGKQLKAQHLKLLLAYSAAYLLALSFLHLIPESFHENEKLAGWFVLVGFILQIVLDYFSQGVEHGHSHVHLGKQKNFIWMVSISLWIHAFIEGMPFGAAEAGIELSEHSGHAHSHGNSLLIGISLHKITEGIVFASLLLNLIESKVKALIWLLVFSLIAPLGAWVYYLTDGLNFLDLDNTLSLVTALLVGIILHVATTILFESEEGHNFNKKKFIAIILGILCVGLID